MSSYGILKGDANGYGTSQSINIRNKDGKFITFWWCFTKDRAYLNEQMNAVVQGNSDRIVSQIQMEIKWQYFWWAWSKYWNASMYFELDDICFLFETYELTPHSEGKQYSDS